MVELSINTQLQSINDFAKALNQCSSIEEVAKMSLLKVREQLNVQVAMIFLSSKKGPIKRICIDGIDRDGQAIEDNWLAEENYYPGESFSGFPFPKIETGLDYGNPNYSNDIIQQYPNMKYLKEYKEKLGDIRSGISVPLNGLGGTFGTLEVLNKQNRGNFSKDDLYWLMLIGSHLAAIISSFMSEEYNKIFKSLMNILVDLEPTANYFDLEEFYNNIAKQIISDITPYKFCCIRIFDEDSLSIKSQAYTKDISIEGRRPSPISDKNYIIRKVYDSQEPEYIDDIISNSSNFFNKDWILKEDLKSFACIPLTIKKNCVGTISVYSYDRIRFHQKDKDILKFLAFLIAAITERVKIIDELKRVKKELGDAQEKFLNISILIGYETELKSIVHQYKNELISMSLIFEDLHSKKNKSSKDRDAIIDNAIKWIESRSQEIQSLIRIEEPIPVQVNELIKQVLKTISISSNIVVREKYAKKLPLISVSPEKMTSVIHNLISNAIISIEKTGKRNGEIIIETSIVVTNEIQKILLRIEDNGTGIPKDIREKIYDRGFTTREDKGGTGMGLHIAKLILEEYGGKIKFESQFGNGTVFFVEIPIKRNQG